MERRGGISPHVSPFTEVADIGALLNRAGFKMLTVDLDEFRIGYPNILALMHDLQGMAENAAAWRRSPHLHRDVLLAASAIYQRMYGNEDGSIPATFQILYMIGWRPGPEMAKPAKRGSQTASMKDIEKMMGEQKIPFNSGKKIK